jgi:hypothetical protein
VERVVIFLSLCNSFILFSKNPVIFLEKLQGLFSRSRKMKSSS